MSLNLLLGTTGLVSFGHVAYFGVGAYVCGILMKTYELPFIIAFPAAGLGTAAFALVSGYFCVRLIKLVFRHADTGVLADRLGDLLQMERRDRRRSGPAGDPVSQSRLDVVDPGSG